MHHSYRFKIESTKVRNKNETCKVLIFFIPPIGEKEKLDFTKVFEPVAHKTITSLEKDEENNSKQLPIYDIILAGVD